MKVVTALLVSASLLGCRAKGPSGALTEVAPADESLVVSSALFAMRMTAEELSGHGPTQSKEQKVAAFLAAAALVSIDESKPTLVPPTDAGEANFRGYLVVAREAMYGIVKEDTLSKPIPVALVYGDNWQPCFGVAKLRATLETATSQQRERSQAYVVEDCPRPPDRYAGVAIRGASAASVRVLVAPETLAELVEPHPDFDALNAIVRKAGKTQQYATDRRLLSREDPSVRAALAVAEASPVVHGARAQYVVQRGPFQSFVFELPTAAGKPGKLELVEVDADGKAAVRNTELH